MADRPTGRKKNITEGGTGVHKTGEGLGTGPVGKGSNFGTTQTDFSTQHSSKGSNQQGNRPPANRAARGGGISLGTIVLIVCIFLIVRSCSDSSYDDYDTGSDVGGQETVQSSTQSETDFSSSLLTALLGGGASYTPSSDYGEWADASYKTGQLDTTVASGARSKRTLIHGNGTDRNVILIYMCGTDLESKSGMASRDLQEMAAASLNDHVRIYVFTGGCKRWHIDGISSSVNQIYEVTSNGLRLIESNMGKGSMVDPDTLTGFLTWAKKNTSGNRYDLIFWDHGGGSVSGFGYDEKNSWAGSMDLKNIDKALSSGGITFDFIGFDACLMATVETALVVADHADYLIASEETEPGVGWYYTTWLSELAADPGKSTLEIGRTIVDTFTSACEESAAGQKTTLSVTDLAELSLTVPDSLKSFASSTSQMITNNNYRTVSDARTGAREFAASSRIDQVDLVHLAMQMGTSEGDALAEAIRGAVKYNLTSYQMTNSYGLSIYFPKKRNSSVDSMVNTYEAIGMDEDYTRMIQEAASMDVYGQAAAGGTHDSLSGGSYAESSDSADAISQLLTAFLSSDFTSVSGLDASNTAFLGKGVSPEVAAKTIAATHFPAERLIWQENADGDRVICMNEEAWKLVHEMLLHMYVEDGEGYFDLGLDNVYEFDDDGNLLAPSDRTWLSIDGHSVAYYYIDEADGVITGYVPALLNDDRVNLLISFDDEHPDGAVIGACYDYSDTEIDVTAKNLTELTSGDKLTFLADYYDKNGKYLDTHAINEPLILSGSMEDLKISNTSVGTGKVRLLYRFTDIYNQNYWTRAIED